MLSKKPAEMTVSSKNLTETRVVAQEFAHFLESIYHATCYLKSVPSKLERLTTTKQQKQSPAPLLTQKIASLFEATYHTATFFKTLYLFTSSDLSTFAIPTLLFGLFTTLSGALLTSNPSPTLFPTLLRTPLALLLIWTNLLIFNISNQRTPSAVEEDRLNKPHRPIPAGRITIDAARRVNLALVPVLLALSWATGVWHETLVLLAMQWMYNDLRGCDESLVLRNGLIAVGYGLYSAIAVGIMVGPGHGLTGKGWQWVGMIALVMLGTQHICDIKDAEGDRTRGRRSAPIVLGDGMCRWSVAVPIMGFSVLCPAFFGLGALSYAGTVGSGGVVAGRTLFMRELKADKMTWKLWALWTCSLFVLPVAARMGDAVFNGSVVWEVLLHYTCPGHDCVKKLNVLAVGGVALAVKGSSLIGGTGVDVERHLKVVPSINVEVVG